MNINKKEIDEALSFYDISDKYYINKCYECIDFIEKNNDLKKKMGELYNIFYNLEHKNVRKLWKKKSKEEIFGKDFHQYCTNVLLLLGYRKNIQNFNLYKLDEEQKTINKKRINNSLLNDININKLDGIRVSQMLWGIAFINFQIIEIGRLQYEYYKEENNDFIKIHIPSGDKLDISEVIKSLRESRETLRRYYNVSINNYTCNSWLLSNQLKNIISPDSNIAKFYYLFDIVEDGDNCIDEIFKNVYNRLNRVDYSLLEENTALQREIKKYLIEGNNLLSGVGKINILKFDK